MNQTLTEIYKIQPNLRYDLHNRSEYTFNYQFEKLREKDFKLLKEIVNIDLQSNEGVYIINDFYIGSSSNILSRIIGHVSEAFYKYWNQYFHTFYDGLFDPVIYNTLKAEKILEHLQAETLSFKQISLSKFDEFELIENYWKSGFPLRNIKEIKIILNNKPVKTDWESDWLDRLNVVYQNKIERKLDLK